MLEASKKGGGVPGETLPTSSRAVSEVSGGGGKGEHMEDDYMHIIRCIIMPSQT